MISEGGEREHYPGVCFIFVGWDVDTMGTDKDRESETDTTVKHCCTQVVVKGK